MLKLGMVAVVFAAISLAAVLVLRGGVSDDARQDTDRRSSSRHPKGRGDAGEDFVIVVREKQIDLSHLDAAERKRATDSYAELRAALDRVAEAHGTEEDEKVREEELNAGISEHDGAATHGRDKLQTAIQHLADLKEQQKIEFKALDPRDPWPFDDPPMKVNQNVIGAAERAVNDAERLGRLSRKGSETIVAPLRAQLDEINANRIARSASIANEQTKIAGLEESLLELAHHNQ